MCVYIYIYICIHSYICLAANICTINIVVVWLCKKQEIRFVYLPQQTDIVNVSVMSKQRLVTSDHVCVCCRKYDYLFGWILVGTSWLTFCNIQLRALDRQGGYPLRCRCTEWSGLKNKTVTSVTETKIKANYNNMILMLTVSSIIVVLMAFTLTLYMLWIMNRISKYVFMPNSQYIQEAYRLSCINTVTSCGMLCI